MMIQLLELAINRRKIAHKKHGDTTTVGEHDQTN